MSQHLVFPVIHTLSGNSYATTFPVTVVSLVSLNELEAALSGSPKTSPNGVAESKTVVLNGVRAYSRLLLDLPAGERSRLCV